MPRMNRTGDEPESASERNPNHLELLVRSLRLIMLFNSEMRDMTLAELATLSGMARSSVRRVMSTLEMMEMAELRGRHYRLTPRILLLAGAYLRSNSLSDRLQPIVERVARDTGYACSAAIPDGDDAVMIARALPQRIITASLTIGLRLPAYSSAVGRVLLTRLSPSELDAYLERCDPQKRTRFTVTDRDELRCLILRDASLGYSLVDREAEEDFRSVAVPVHGRGADVLCALHVGLNVGRASAEEVLGQVLPVLFHAASEAGAILSV